MTHAVAFLLGLVWVVAVALPWLLRERARLHLAQRRWALAELDAASCRAFRDDWRAIADRVVREAAHLRRENEELRRRLARGERITLLPPVQPLIPTDHREDS